MAHLYERPFINYHPKGGEGTGGGNSRSSSSPTWLIEVVPAVADINRAGFIQQSSFTVDERPRNAGVTSIVRLSHSGVTYVRYLRRERVMISGD